jgi:hypothetical protein
MPIQNTGSDIRLRGNTGDSVTDINEEINGNATDADVSLGTLNTSAFTNVSDGSVVTGRAMSEMQGYAAFESALPQTEADGALGESLLFDGSNSQYASFTPSLTGNRRTWTMSFWVKINKNDTQETIISQGSTSVNNVFVIRRESTNKFAIYTERSGGYSKAIANSLIIDNSGWYNVVIAFDVTKTYSNDKVRIYINGIEEKDITYTNSGGLFNDTDWAFNVASSAIRIGQYRYNNSDYLDGVIADFKFIDGQQLRPDSFGELIQGIWIPKAFNTASTDTLVTSNLIANYQLNGDATDETGNYNGSSSGITFYKNNYGIANIDGSSSRIVLTNSNNLQGTQITFCIWFLIDTINNNPLIANYNGGNYAAGDFYLTYRSDLGGFNAQVHDGTGYQILARCESLNTGVWHQVCYTKTNDTTGGSFYLNGLKLENTEITQNSSSGGTILNTSDNLQIGNFLTQTNGFDGKIGELQIYNSQLTDAQILQNYNATKHKYTYGLNGFWLPLNNRSVGSIESSSNLKLHLDASNSSSYTGSGTTWSDLTSNNNHATLINSPNYLSTNGGIFEFDGSADYATIPHSTDIELSNNGFTAEAWVYHTDSNTNIILDKGDNGSRVRGYNLQISGNNLDLRIHANNLTTATIKILGTTALNVNAWNHVAFTLNNLSSSATAITYINGIKDGEDTDNMGSYLNNAGNDNLFIASQSGYSQVDKFDGKIAQIRLYNKALTANEINTNYRATQGNYEQVGVSDISGNANHFTATNIDYTDHIKDEPLDNYATLNPSEPFANKFTFSEGNTKFTSATTGYHTSSANMALTSGKWYVEFKYLGSSAYGSARIGPSILGDITGLNSYGGTTTNSWMWGSNGAIYHNNANIASSSVTATTGDIIGFAIDLDNYRWFINKNGSFLYSHDPATPSTGIDISGFTDYFIGFHAYTTTDIGKFYFGAESFNYTVPSGYKAVSTKNLPAPAFDPDGTTPDKPSNYFKAVTYQGNGGTQGEAYGYKEGSRAAVFDGSSSSFIQIPATATTPIDFSSENFTISMWINPVSLPTSGNIMSIFGKYSSSSDSPTTKRSIIIRINSSGQIAVIENDGSAVYTQTSTGTISANTWSFFAYTRNGTTSNIYIDNNSGESLARNNTIKNGSTQPIALGGTRPSTGDFNGKLDEVRIFDKALSSTEAGYLADDDTTNIDAISNLVAYYDMEGDANDESGSATTYNGTDTNVTYTQDKPYGNIDVGFAPDLVWIKNRDTTNNHTIFDSIRGNYYIQSSTTNAEATSAANTLSSFDTNGFTVSGGGNAINGSYDYVAWCWKAGGSVTPNNNTDGTITSTVSANQDAGFSIVKWTGNNTAGATVGHGLSSAPEMIIIKNYSQSIGQRWVIGHNNMDSSSPWNYYLEFDADARAVNNSRSFNGTAPTSSVFSIGNDTQVNADDLIAYCFHSVDGFSKIGSYTGNGSTDGTFVYTGFKPAFLLVKSTSGDNWTIYDGARNTSNTVTKNLKPNSSATEAEETGAKFNFLSNGFKAAGAGAGEGQANKSGYTFIYMAFAEDPVKYSNGVATLGDGNEFIQGGNYPEDNFNTTTYTGNSGTQKIITGYKPDLVWIKSRNGAFNNMLTDSINGDNTHLIANTTAVLDTNTSAPQFNTNGFTLGNLNNNWNNSSYTYVAWSWKAAGYDNTYNILENGTVTSSASASTLGLDTGTITPSGVSANRDNGFSIIKYTFSSPLASQTVPHGLDSPPEMIITKCTTDTGNWYTYHKDVGTGKYLILNSTAIAATYANGFATVDATTWQQYFRSDAQSHIAYCWHSVPGYSKIGSYTGDGGSSNDIYLGFEPKWVMIKLTSTSGQHWYILDSSRENLSVEKSLSANLNDIEETLSGHLDFTSTGFRLTKSSTAFNGNGSTYVYMAFAHR